MVVTLGADVSANAVQYGKMWVFHWYSALSDMRPKWEI